MILSVGKILHTPGKQMDFQFSMDLSDVDFGGYRPVAEPVVVTGNVRNSADVLQLTMNMSTVLHSVCDRCAKPFSNPFDTDFTCIIADEVQNEDNIDIVLVDGDGNIDLDDIARTAFVLNMDTKTLCSEDCKGICPGCGADLNVEACRCKKEIDPRLAVLAKLMEKNSDEE